MKGEANIVTLHINDVLPNRFQPRIRFDKQKIAELADSIKKYGVIQPIIVRNIGDKYEIIAGERRYKATVMAGLTEIPAIVNNLDDKDSSEVALIENVQRQDLTPIEEAISYKKILDMGYLTQESLATKLGVSQSAVANKLRLLNLSELVQDALLENKISERHARSLLKLKKEEEQKNMLNKIIKERLTVRKTDEEIQKVLDSVSTDSNKDKEKNNINQEEIEILNLLNSYKETQEKKKEKEEEPLMNPNDPMNQFDIPAVNIIDDTPVETNPIPAPPVMQEEPVINMAEPIVIPNVGAIPTMPSVAVEVPVEVPVEEFPTEAIHPNISQASNPGFMDIDKIEREAVDIMDRPEDTPAPMESLLASEEKEPVEAPIKEISINSGMPKGRFFDVMPSIQDNMVSNQVEPEPILNQSGSIFGAQTTMMSPTQGSPAPMESFTSILDDPIIEPINLPSAMPTMQVNPEPISEAVAPSIFEAPTPETIEDSRSPFVSPFEPSLNNISENMVSSVPTEIVPEPVIPEVPLVEPSFDFGQTPAIPSVESVEIPAGLPVDSIPVMPEPIPSIAPVVTELTPVFQNPTINENIVNPVPPISNINIEGPFTPTAPTLPVEQNIPAVSMRQALDVVRNAVRELNRLGYHVDTEEMDLQNLYQINIKIDKE